MSELQVNENIVNEEDIEETSSVEEALNFLALEDEVERVENFKKEINTSDEARDSEIFKDGMKIAETIIAMTKTMVNEGIDYNNALAIASNHITSKQNIELAKHNAIVQQQQSI